MRETTAQVQYQSSKSCYEIDTIGVDGCQHVGERDHHESLDMEKLAARLKT